MRVVLKYSLSQRWMYLIWKHDVLWDKMLVFKKLNVINCILIYNLNVPYNAKFCMWVVSGFHSMNYSLLLVFSANSILYMSYFSTKNSSSLKNLFSESLRSPLYIYD